MNLWQMSANMIFCEILKVPLKALDTTGYWLHSAVIQSPHLFDKKLLACLGRCVTRSCICTLFANNLQTISSSWVHLSTGLPATLTASRHAADWALITSSRHSALMGCATVFKSSIRKLERKVSTGVFQSAASLICCCLRSRPICLNVVRMCVS